MALIDFSLSDVGSLFTGIREAITGEKIKDPIEVAKMELQLTALEQRLTEAQIEVNKAEATNPNLFVSGWRPSIGWVGSMALALAFIPKSIVLTIMWTYQCWLAFHGQALDVILPPFPDLGIGDVIALLGSMLGVAGLRTYEKKMGVDTKTIGSK